MTKAEANKQIEELQRHKAFMNKSDDLHKLVMLKMRYLHEVVDGSNPDKIKATNEKYLKELSGAEGRAKLPQLKEMSKGDPGRMALLKQIGQDFEVAADLKL
jgi:phage terminase small subunit